MTRRIEYSIESLSGSLRGPQDLIDKLEAFPSEIDHYLSLDATMLMDCKCWNTMQSRSEGSESRTSGNKVDREVHQPCDSQTKS